MKNIRNSKYSVRLPFLLAVAIAAGIFIGASMADPKTPSNALLSTLIKFREIITFVDKDYVDEVDTDNLVEEAIVEMLEKLDPHSVYIPKEEMELTRSELEGAFDGIGIEFSIIKDTIYVIAPLSGGPSKKVGLQTGDKIITVEGENVAGVGIKNRGVFKRLRGPKGSEVTVEIKRKYEEELLTFTIIRDKIPQYSVDVHYMVDEEIGYIKISRFSTTTYDEFKEALSNLKVQGMEKLILDLQGNPGGYMDRAIDVVDELLPGNDMIVYTKGKETRNDSEARAHREGIFEEKPVIVLIDQGSASASEIVSGALQDNDRALIVGRRSFGKGLVQRQIALIDGSGLRLTVSRYYIPSGRSIQKPYENGTEDYHSGVYNRYGNGELFYSDSIKVDESKQFKTSGGRLVYGGGGIIPDVFVAVDTGSNPRYLNRLFTSNAIGEYTLNYYQKQKTELEKMDYKDYRKNFEVSDEMLQELVATAKGVDVPFNEGEFNGGKELIKIHLKAQIARRVWDNKGFYPIFNQTNEVFMEALKLFDRAEDLIAQK